MTERAFEDFRRLERMRHSAMRLVSGPDAEPISLTLAKKHLAVQHTLDDTLIEDIYIPAARALAERLSGYKFITQTWDFDFAGFPTVQDGFEFSIRPIQSVESISYLDASGGTQTFGTLSGSPLTPEEYTLQKDQRNSRVILRVNQAWPFEVAGVQNAVTVRVVAGFGDDSDSIPSSLKTLHSGMLLVIGHFYENRENVIVGTEATSIELPLGIRDILLNPKIG